MEIYLDNAATSFPKPEQHIQAVTDFMIHIGGNPGRGGHRKSSESTRIVEQARTNLADILGVDDPARLVFTHNATDALNLAVKGLYVPNSEIIVSSFEHNSLVRPLTKLQHEFGVTVTKVLAKPDALVNRIAEKITEQTSMIAVLHASNVTGEIFPIFEIAELAHTFRIPIVVDGTQTAGSLPIDLSTYPPIFFAFAGHKGLLGAQGTGGLVIPEDGTLPRTSREGGTGSFSENEDQPSQLPDRYESGTLNGLGIAGLKGGTEFILEKGIETIRQHEISLRSRLWEKMSAMKKIILYGCESPDATVGVLSFNIDGFSCGDVSHVLDTRYNILCRSGLHCAPWAHQTIGTLKSGTVRLSIGPFTEMADIDFTLDAIQEIAS